MLPEKPKQSVFVPFSPEGIRTVFLAMNVRCKFERYLFAEHSSVWQSDAEWLGVKKRLHVGGTRRKVRGRRRRRRWLLRFHGNRK